MAISWEKDVKMDWNVQFTPPKVTSTPEPELMVCGATDVWSEVCP